MERRLMSFRGLVYSRFKNEAALAREMGWTRQRLNRITSGQKTPDICEVSEIASSLGISVTDVAEFFLPDKSPYRQHSN